ncbi:lumenal Hsp70 protein [Lignoscripta atroalba]|nr:lumenal Hsp70 protein [Lignoscripta atroalba]
MPPPGRRRFSNLALCVSLLLLFTSTASAASAVLGIDLGTEYIKAALVKPGIPLEIVLTKDSKRKEYAAIAFKPLNAKSATSDSGALPERVYGGDALALSARFPGDVYSNLKPLLGLEYKGNEVVAEYGARHPGLQIVKSKSRGTVGFSSESVGSPEEPFMVEELLAMELKNIKGNAESFAGKGSTIRDVVITIPAFYTAEEKRAVELAADLADLRVLALVTDGLSVGLNYATSRTFPVINDGGKPEYNLVYDMGAGSTTATVLKFQGKTVKDVGKFNKTIQEVQVMGTGWDKTLGGDAFNVLIMDDMVEKFVNTNRMKALGTSGKHVKAHGRTMAKLWKEAERIRQVLSANTETSASFEGLYYEDVNFRYKLTRDDFEKMASAYADRVRDPVRQALESAKLELSDLESVILHGGAVRTPFVQKQLEAAAGSADKIRTNVNSDEAAVFGAAFKAAGISPSFRVKEIRAGEIAGHAVSLSWTSGGSSRQQKLFVPGSQVGTEKQVPFQILEDFSFDLSQQVSQGQAETMDIPVIRVQTKNLTTSVKELNDKFSCVAADVSTKFSIRLSPVDGLPEVVQVSISCEVTDLEKKGGVVDDVKGFFGFGSKKDDQVPLQDEAGEQTLESEAESSSTSSPAESKASETPTSTTKSEATTKDIKKRTEVIYIGFSATVAGLPELSTTEFKRIKDRIALFDASDRSRLLREEAFNGLEAYTYKVRDLVTDKSFIEVSTEEQRAVIEDKFKSASDWLYGDGAEASRDTLKARIKELRQLVDPVQKRVDEARKRPDEVRLLKEALEQTQTLIKVVKEQSEKASAAAASAASASPAPEAQSTASQSANADDDFADLDDEPSATSSSSPSPSPKVPDLPTYSAEDLRALTDTYESVDKWLSSKLAEQDELSPSDDPVILSSDLAAKSKELNKVVLEVLQKKLKMPPKPKSASKPKTSKSKGAKKNKTSKSSSAETTAGDDTKAGPSGPKVDIRDEL